MKKMNYVFAYFTMAVSIIGASISIYLGQSFAWQLSTFIWAMIALMNQRQIDTNEDIIISMRKHVDEILELNQSLNKKQTNDGEQKSNSRKTKRRA